MTEAELIQLYREHTGLLYAYVSRRVGGDRTLAEDIVQDTWLSAVTAWPGHWESALGLFTPEITSFSVLLHPACVSSAVRSGWIVAISGLR